MRTSWVVLIAATFLFALMSFQGSVEAAGGNTKSNQCDSSHSGNVFTQFHCQKSSGKSGQKQQDAKKSNTPSVTKSQTVWMFVKVFLVLAVVVALIYLLLRFVNAKTKAFSEGKVVQTIGGATVGSNRSIQIVKVGDRILVVGVGDTVSMLKEIDDQEEVEKLLSTHQRDDVIDQSFFKFRDWLTKRKTGAEQVKKQGFQSMLEGRLKQMAQQRKDAFDDWKKKGFRE